MPSLAANIIVRNEEKRIETLLKIIRPYVDELVIVDQESTDNTWDICHKYADTHLRDICTGQADSSRQLAMDNTKSDWILSIDADEYPTQRLLNEVKIFIKDDIADGYFLCLCILRGEIDNFYPIEKIMSIGDGPGDIPHVSWPNQYRLYRRGRVDIAGKLHTGLKPRINDLVRYMPYNAIVEYKTNDEQEQDRARYASIVYGTFNKNDYIC